MTRQREKPGADIGRRAPGRRGRTDTRGPAARISAARAVLPRRLAPRKPPVQRRSRATVEAILGAAAELMAECGPSVSTNQIARRAGVSVGSLYQYFPCREAIVAALFERHAAAVEQVMAAAFADLREARVPLRASFRRLFVGLQALHDADPRLAAAVSPYVEGHQPLAEIVRRREERFRHELVEVLRRRTDVRRGDFQLMAALLFDVADALTRSLMHGDARRFDRAEAIAEAVEALCRYLEPWPTAGPNA